MNEITRPPIIGAAMRFITSVFAPGAASLNPSKKPTAWRAGSLRGYLLDDGKRKGGSDGPPLELIKPAKTMHHGQVFQK